MEFPEGEGGLSAGAMVSVHEASNERDGRAVVELLETHAIPAVLDRDIAGSVAGWQIAQADANRVLVPSQMRSKAAQVLHQHDYQTTRERGPDRRSQRFTPAFSASPFKPAEFSGAAVGVQARTGVGAEQTGQVAWSDAAEDVEDEGPIERGLPEPSSLRGRMIKALAAVAFGTAFQRAMELSLGVGGTQRLFGARAPILDEPWRLVTAGFVHGSLSHFVSNGLFAVVIGVVLFGTHRVGATAFVWLLSSIIGLCSETSLSSAALVIGASAGNYGLVGLWTRGQMQRAKVAALPVRERVRTIGVLLLLVPGALTPFSSTGTKIAVIAHAAGYLSGFLLGYIFHRRLDDEEPALERRSRLAGALTVAITSLAFASAAIQMW